MGKIVNDLNINKIFSIGNLSYYITLNCNNGSHFYDKNNLIDNIIYLINKYNDIKILVKGSRKNELDKLIKNIINKVKC